MSDVNRKSKLGLESLDDLKKFESDLLDAVRKGAPLLGKQGVMTPL